MKKIVTVFAACLFCSACAGKQPLDVHAQPDTAFVAQQLAQLDTLAKPDNVDAETWRQLKSALRTSLEDRLARGTSSAPTVAGARPRLCFALSTLLYLSYVTITRDFLSFQWDNMLIECGFLAAFLRTDAPAPIAHFLFRVVLFKLYFESGLAKWGSPIRDWQVVAAKFIACLSPAQNS